MMSQWLAPVDPIEVGARDLEKTFETQPTAALAEAADEYSRRYLSEPCLSTATMLLTVGRCLRRRGIPEYLAQAKADITFASLQRCDKSCCKVIHHSSATNSN